MKHLIVKLNEVLKSADKVLSYSHKLALCDVVGSLEAFDNSNKHLEKRNMLLARGEAIKKRACTFHTKRYMPEESITAKRAMYEEIQAKGYFIQFGEEAEESSVSGFGNFTVAIVEGEDGQVYTINPNNLKFIK